MGIDMNELIKSAPEWATHYGPESYDYYAVWAEVECGDVVRWEFDERKLMAGRNWKELGDLIRPLGDLIPLNRDQLIVESQPVTDDQVERIKTLTSGVEVDLDAPLEWDGEGMPPVGTVCVVFHEHPHEYFSHHVGKEVTIIAHDEFEGKIRPLYRVELDDGPEYHALVAGCFRPILTAEQKAAKDREDAIKAIDEILATAIEDDQPMADAIYSAGYRLQEQQQ